MIEGLTGLLFETTDPETKELIYHDIKEISNLLAELDGELEEIIAHAK